MDASLIDGEDRKTRNAGIQPRLAKTPDKQGAPNITAFPGRHGSQPQ